jgi:hypothetical protein
MSSRCLLARLPQNSTFTKPFARAPDSQSIDIADGHPVWRLASQHIELMSKDEDLGLQRGARPEQSEHGAADQPEEIAHGNDYQPIRR